MKFCFLGCDLDLLKRIEIGLEPFHETKKIWRLK